MVRPKRLSRAAILLVLIASVCAAADRKWQTGTWVDAGIKRAPYVGGGATANRAPSPESMMPAPLMADVGTYVIETDDERIEIQDMTPIANGDSLDRSVVLGASVTFAIEKKTAYIRMAGGKEHRLLVLKREPKKKPQPQPLALPSP